MAESTEPQKIDDLALALLLSRLDKQDGVQDTTLKEVRKTNGSVRDLQSRVGLLETANVDARVTALEEDKLLVVDRTAQRAARSANRDRRMTVAAQLGSLLTGAGLLELGHALQLW